MELDAHSCYRALRTRDRRFDGRFFTGVLSTRVYCRPICPARTPKVENCVFFACAAAAADAGFRPCLRCRPEASPETPAWQGTSATVSRALRLISEGGLDQGNTQQLATRLGVGARHLSRLFKEHLGTTPKSIADTRRLHLAKKLIDDSSLPMTQVATAAGFQSLRRFNQVIQHTYGRSPSELRRRKTEVTGVEAGLEIGLSVRTPFDWNRTLSYLQPRAIPHVEVIEDGRYTRSVSIDGQSSTLTQKGTMAIEFRNEQLWLRLSADLVASVSTLVNRVREMFDTDAVTGEIESRLSQDPHLARIVEHQRGLRVPGTWDRFELAVRAVLGQQITVAGATRLAGRIAASFGERLETSECLSHPGLDRLFPTPDALVEADIETVGMPKSRAETLRQLAKAILDGELNLDGSVSLEQTVAELQSIKGIGPWTANYVAMRGYKEPNAFPAGDLGLRKAIERVDRQMSERELERRSQEWAPWRAYAAMHLWQYEGERA